MTATARAMRMGARSVTTGKQLLGQRHGPATHVGPNALLRATSYPAPTVTVPDTQGMNGPLFVPATPPGAVVWRINGVDEIDPSSNGLALNWTAGGTTPYVYNNNPSNLGGVVPLGGMHIDGWLVPAGVEVFQFMDLSNPPGVIYQQGLGPTLPGVVFRGCRIRHGAAVGTGDGFFNNNTGATPASLQLWILYCDLGGAGSATDGTGLIDDVFHSYNSGSTFYRNYVSFVGSGIFPVNTGPVADLYENYIEQICVFGGDHLNGISFNGSETNCRVKRNYIVAAKFDPNGQQVDQTDCIAFFEDTGGYPGTGTNPDGTVGYYVTGNYLGGTGYCIYPPAGAEGDPTNFHMQDNLITTSSYPIINPGNAPGGGGGFNGPIYTDPGWGTSNNTQSNNLWADGTAATTSFI